MPKIHVVFHKTGHLLGYLPDKESRELFEQQRNMEDYRIEKVKEPHIRQMLDKEYKQVGYIDGMLIFPDEEDYYNEGYYQMLMDFQVAIERMVRKVVPFLKITKEEREIVDGFLADCYDTLQAVTADELDIDEAEIFDLAKMVRHIISTLN